MSIDPQFRPASYSDFDDPIARTAQEVGYHE